MINKIKTYLIKLLKIKLVKKLTLEEFLGKVRLLALSDDRTFYSAKAERGTHLHSDGTKTENIHFSCYVSGYSHYTDTNMEGSLKQLEDAMNTKEEVGIIQEVVI